MGRNEIDIRSCHKDRPDQTQPGLPRRNAPRLRPGVQQGPDRFIAAIAPPQNRRRERTSLVSELVKQGNAVARAEQKHELRVDEILSRIDKENRLEALVDTLFNVWERREEAIREAKEEGIAMYVACAGHDWVLETLRRRINQVIKKEKDPAQAANKTLFRIWGWKNIYDAHMKGTGHDDAIDTLLKQLIELHNLGFGRSSRHIDKGLMRHRRGDNSIFADRKLLEMSCGSGTVIELLCNSLSQDTVARLSITGNDISPQMKRLAAEKLEGVCDVEFTSHDLRGMEFEDETFDVTILAQTLHLITDPKLREEMDQVPVAWEEDYTQIKTDVIRDAFRTMRKNGYFVMIDEWPALLSDGSKDPLEEIIHDLFHQTFEPIRTRGLFRDRIMRNIPGARFVAELKARIDKEHSMYLMFYRKDPDKLERRGRVLPDTQEKAEEEGVKMEEVEEARKDAVAHIIGAFIEMDPHFIAGHQPVNGEKLDWTEFSPVDGKAIFIDDPEKVGELEAEKYETIIIERVLHKMPEEQRNEMMEKAIGSLEVGGAIIIIDEWASPKNSIHPAGRRDFRDEVIEKYKRRIVFEGALRETIVEGFDSGMYGYLWRKVR